jgi:hypothetical protein
MTIWSCVHYSAKEIAMETTTIQSSDLAVRILAAIPAGQRTFALSSEEPPEFSSWGN